MVSGVNPGIFNCNLENVKLLSINCVGTANCHLGEIMAFEEKDLGHYVNGASMLNFVDWATGNNLDDIACLFGPP